MRGYHGKEPHDLSGPAREAAMASFARKHRVKAGTEGISKKFRKFLQDEGLAPGGASKPRTKERRPSQRGPKPFDLKGAVARYKRTGVLPHVSVDVVNNAALVFTGVDGRALRRMTQAMLVRSGGDILNPGPNFDDTGNVICRYSGMRVQGERVRFGGKNIVLVCQACATRLTEVMGSQGFHPGQLVAEPPTVVPSTITEPSAPPMPTEIAHIPEKVAREERPPTPRPSQPPVAHVPPPVVPHTVEPVAAARVEPPVLRGHDADFDDLAKAMSEASGYEILPEMIELNSMDLDLKGERRLAANRNVKLIDSKIELIEAKADITTGRPELALAVFAVFVAASIFSVMARASGCGGKSIDCCFSSTMLFLLPLLPVSIYLWLYEEVIHTVYFTYSPHLVSSLVMEYDRGTSAEVVRSTIRQKVRRLACLPIPDKDALIIIASSEYLAEALIEGGDFFSERAACFALPS